jgi:ABC-2 type transport system permease protein
MAEFQETAKERLGRLDALPFERAGAPDQLVSGAAGSIRDIWKHRELLGLLTKRELKARYKDSSLGFVWSLIKPLTQLLIYYAVYIFAGLTIYTLFSEIVGGGTSSIIANSGLVKKVYLPREIFPLSAVGSALFNLCIQLLILIVTAALVGTLTFGPHLLYGIGALGVIIIYGTALGVLLAALNVFLRDVQYLVEVVLMLFMWGSPILYHWTFAIEYMPGWLAQIYLNNPITLAVIGFQEALWAPNSSSDSLDGLALRLVVAAAVGVVFLFISQRVFSRLQGNFAQEL